MNTKFTWACITVFIVIITSTRACGTTPQLYAQWALSTNAGIASNAVAKLRTFGPEGLQALLTTHESIIARQNASDPQWQKLRTALEAVGGQRDCHVSRLFWHKDFETAKSEAQRTGKPILSLRLLGNLDEELSCANSRFFRTTLYANKEVSGYLRHHFVLHWKSVRPVPRITIDMGDGRKIERTITGNSIHYVLDTNGEVVDALPGLYGPRAFIAGLQQAERTAVRVAKLDAVTRGRELQNYHTIQLANVNGLWANDLSRVTPMPTSQLNRPVTSNGTIPARNTPAVAAPPAAAAMPLAISKSAAERPMLRAAVPSRENLERTTTEEVWAKIAALHSSDAVLDQDSVDLIRAKTRPAGEAMRLTQSKMRVEDPMLKTIQNLQRSIAEDSVRNEYAFHAKIHEWLAVTGASREVDSLNRRVYAELFLTPDSDPWLGLAPADTFSALDNGGLVQK